MSPYGHLLNTIFITFVSCIFSFAYLSADERFGIKVYSYKLRCVRGYCVEVDCRIVDYCLLMFTVVMRSVNVNMFTYYKLLNCIVSVLSARSLLNTLMYLRDFVQNLFLTVCCIVLFRQY